MPAEHPHLVAVRPQPFDDGPAEGSGTAGHQDRGHAARVPSDTGALGVCAWRRKGSSFAGPGAGRIRARGEARRRARAVVTAAGPVGEGSAADPWSGRHSAEMARTLRGLDHSGQ
ncbi:hypothetical protein GCM10018777_21960 [Streptomyces albogriseolus]|nr:hypothetical protein GCM10018777_21960 [Streptomyces viridodiastaticus]